MRVKARNYDVRLGDAVALLNTAIETLQLRAKALRGNGIGHGAQRQVRCHKATRSAPATRTMRTPWTPERSAKTPMT